MLKLSKFKERLEELIFDERETLSALAQKIGCSQGTLSRYLAGNTAPTLDMAVRLADYFKCTTDYLLGIKDVNEASSFNTCPPFGGRFTDVCAEKQVSRYKLQKLTGIPESVMRYWVRGITEPSVVNLVLVAEKLNVSVDYLLGREK